jgi:hypothetical protein
LLNTSEKDHHDVAKASNIRDGENCNDDNFHHDIENNTTRTTNFHDNHDTEYDDEHHHQQRGMVRKVLRKYSSVVRNPTEHAIDENRLHRTLKDAGLYAYGLQGIAVWVFDDDQDRLVGIPGGFWYNEAMVQPSEELQRLTDKTRSDHVPMETVAPGTDIAGLLWLESNTRDKISSIIHNVTSQPQIAHHHHQQQQQQHQSKKQTPNDSLSHVVDPNNNTRPSSTLIWRDLKSLVQDPDTAKGPRMELLEQAGFDQATGIRFEIGVTTGFIIYFVKSELDENILNGVANVSYLRQCTQFIGSAVAMTEARRAIVGQLMLGKRLSVTSDAGSGTAGDDDPATKEQGSAGADNQGGKTTMSSTACHRLTVWVKKIKGGGLQIPPGLSLRQSLWTALGAFIGLLVLSSLNEYYKLISDEEYSLLIGPFGALMTLQYGLPGAPASQPRNAIMGQAVAGAVSLAFTYIPETILATWLRRAVGPAISIAFMVKLGFVHPPAGAHAVLYASGSYSFVFYGLVVLSTAISVIPATLVNNMSRKRQYPTYWGVPKWIQTFFDWETGSQKEKDKN